jgi:hypothetical protein
MLAMSVRPQWSHVNFTAPQPAGPLQCIITIGHRSFGFLYTQLLLGEQPMHTSQCLRVLTSCSRWA